MTTTWFRNLPLWVKATITITGGVVIGTVTYFALSQYDKKARSKNTKPANANNGNKKELITTKRILVLGLSGAGKSSILSRFSKVEKERREIKPTDGFSVMCLQTSKGTFNIWEIGGTEKNRAYWENFLQDTDLLVFVVDSSADKHGLDNARSEFNKLLENDKLKAVPVLLLLNKQDVVGAKTQRDIETHFCCKEGAIAGHTLRILGTRAAPNLPSHPSVGEAERMIISMCLKSR